jgi:curved DNA-binding protein CbpA
LSDDHEQEAKAGMTSSNRNLAHRLAWSSLALLCCLLVGLLQASHADAKRNIQTAIYDDLYVTGEATRWLDRTKKANAGSVRIPVRWKYIAPRKPRQPRLPRDPAYKFSGVDRAVRAATQRGLQPMLMVTTAPRWAERGKRKAGLKQESAWNPDPDEFGKFATAVATRYSGKLGGLPRVKFYEAWNEPNYGLTHLAPQWKKGKPYGVELYRKLLNAMYKGVKGVQRSNKIVAPSLGPFGTTPKRKAKRNKALAGVRPMFFLRELFCLKHNKKMRPKKRCPKKKRARFDILSHHPINPGGSPRAKAKHKDSVIGGDVRKLRKVLKKAQRANYVLPKKGKRPIWATEFWWESNPPNKRHGVKLKKQARNISEALYVFWKARVQRAFYFRIKDTADTSSIHGGASGLYTAKGKPKPALKAFSFPFVADRRNKRKVVAWGKAPAKGKLKIQRKKGKRWKTIKRTRVKRGKVFKQNLKLRGKKKVRATVGRERSLVWPVKRR